jgi:GAF domain-containing protein
VIAEGRALGLVRFLVPASPSDAQLALMDAAADQIGLTLANAELAEQTRRQLAATQAMGEVARLAASTGVQTTLEALVARIRELTEADGAIVYLADARGETYSAAAQSLADPSFTADLGRLESPTRRIGHGLIGWVIAAGEAAFVPDVRRDPRLASGRTATRPPEASIIVPMRVQGRTLGCLRLSRISKRRFTESDLWLAQMLADQAALAVQSAQEQERTRVGAPAEAALATVAGAMHEIAIPVEELLRVAKAEDSVDPGELRTQLAAARSAAERIQTAMHVLQVTVDRAVDGTRDKSAALVQAGAGGEPGHDRVDAG